MFEQVDNRGSLENVGTKWVAEISEHCPGVKVVLCALKCDLREEQEKEDEEPQQPGPGMIQYNEGLEVARRIGALRYLGLLPPRLSRDMALTWTRMLRHAKPRRQRSIYRSCPSRPPGQTCSIQRRQQVHRDVNQPNFTFSALHQHDRHH